MGSLVGDLRGGYSFILAHLKITSYKTGSYEVVGTNCRKLLKINGHFIHEVFAGAKLKKLSDKNKKKGMRYAQSGKWKVERVLRFYAVMVLWC